MDITIVLDRFRIIICTNKFIYFYFVVFVKIYTWMQILFKLIFEFELKKNLSL